MLYVLCVGGSAGPGGCVSVLQRGFICRMKDSSGRHSCSMEVGCGFLRPSLEGTLAFNRSRLVGEEEQMEVVGTYRIRFLLSSFCLSFVFISCFLLSSFCLSFVFISCFLLSLSFDFL